MDHDAHEHHGHGSNNHGPNDHDAHNHAAANHDAHNHAAHHDGTVADTHAAHGAQRSAGWGMAVSATLHCLTGCAIGEVLGMVIGTALGWHDAATIVLAIALAFVFGYALTMRSVMRAGLPFKDALKVALAADTISIAVMEIVDNALMIVIPGAMSAGLADAKFWLSLASALAIAFVLTVPVNRWLIARGKGHAVVHQHHH